MTHSFRLHLMAKDVDSALLLAQGLEGELGDDGTDMAIQICLDLHREKQARHLLTRLDEMPKTDPLRWRFVHGAVAEAEGNHEVAEADFRAIIERDPSHAPALNYLGYIWAERGIQLDEAERLVRRALQVDPDSGAYLDSLGWILYRGGDVESAVEILTRAFHRMPHDATVIEHLADALAAAGRREEALFYYRLAIRCLSERTDTIYTRIRDLR